MKLPYRIIAADWSKEARKRRMARAEQTPDGRFQVLPTEPAGDPGTLLARAQAGMPEGATVLMGFDFPMGLPLPYARRLGVPTFREALPLFGQAAFTDFYEISSQPCLQQPFYPPPSREKGVYTRQALANGLKVPQFDDLLRQCDRATPTRPAAGCMFFTLGGQQPGPGMIAGWRELLAPALEDIRLWPFDGPLDSLLGQPGIVVCEVYPAEGYRQLGLLPGRRWSKRRIEDRKAAAARLLARAGDNSGIVLSPAARAQLAAGCTTEDDFDALVALVFMIEVVQGRIACPVPADPATQAVEGWILGQSIPEPILAGSCRPGPPPAG